MPQYQYSYVGLEEVVSNIDEYIIPECQEACKALWNKNIETFMVSNREDDHLYVLILDLSDENMKIMKDNMNSSPKNYTYDNYRGLYGIMVDGITSEDAKKLSSLTSVFKIQDTTRYKTSEKFLEEYKRTDGEYYYDKEIGDLCQRINPDLENDTLGEALKKTNKESLYIKDENRVYESEFFLNWHERYKKSKEIDKMMSKEEKLVEEDQKHME